MPKLDLNALKGGPKTPEAAKPTESPKPAAGLAFLKNRAAATTPAPTPTPAPVAPKPTGGLGFLKNQAVTAPKPKSEPIPDHQNNTLEGWDRIINGNAEKAAAADDLDLDALLNDESAAPPSAPKIKSRFADEVPADPPERVLPEDADKQMQHFAASLNTVYEIIHEPDMLGGVIKNIMMELSQKPEYRKLIQPKDIHTMIKGMRDSMGMAKIKKEESKAKRAGGGKKKSTKIDDLDVLAALDELGDFS